MSNSKVNKNIRRTSALKRLYADKKTYERAMTFKRSEEEIQTIKDKLNKVTITIANTEAALNGYSAPA